MAEPPDDSTQFCRECGTEAPLHASYCEECGAALELQAGHEPQQGQQPRGQQQPVGPPPQQGGRPPRQGQQQGGRQPRQGQHPQQHQQDDDSTSTVLIIVAVAVVGFFALFILAPILAAFVLGLGDTTSNVGAPNPTLDSNYDEDTQTLEVEMTGGEAFTASQVRVSGDALEDGQTWAEVAGVNPDREVTVGDTITLTGLPLNFEIELVWNSEDDGRSVVIFQRTGPAA